jgi:hypothetical protein
MNLFLEFMTKYKNKENDTITEKLKFLMLLAPTGNTCSSEWKFKFLNFINGNMFIENTIKEEFLFLFYETQKIYYGFTKLARIFKIKKMHTYNVCDLSMMPFMNNNLFHLFKGKFLYLFTRRDLICLLNSALCYSPNLFLQPLVTKNPYTNVAFTETNLYNIYYFLKKGDLEISNLIHAFFKSNFNLTVFLRENVAILRLHSILNFVKNTDCEELRKWIEDMLYEYCPSIEIHKDLCSTVVVPKMKHFLKKYLKINYAIDTITNRNVKKKQLRHELKEFKKNNKTFGEKYVESKSIFTHLHP